MTYSDYLIKRGKINKYLFHVLSSLNPCKKPLNGLRCTQCPSCQFVRLMTFPFDEQYFSDNFSKLNFDGVLPDD